MFGIKRKCKEENIDSNKSMEINFPIFQSYSHDKKLEDIFYRVKAIEKDFYDKNTPGFVSYITFPASYYTNDDLINTTKRTIQVLLEQEFVKAEFVSYKVNGKEIDTKNTKVEELENGNLRITKIFEKEIIVENYTFWSAVYKAKRIIPIKTIKELKQIKRELEKLK